MTATFPLPTTPIPGVHRALDALAAYDPAHLSDAEQAALLRELGRITSRVHAFKLRLLRAAQTSGTHTRAGVASTSQWAAKTEHTDTAAAAKEVKIATGLTSHGMSPQGPTATALDNGDLSAAHAEVIVTTNKNLPGGLNELQRRRIEQSLVAKATRMSPQTLRKHARRALAVVEESTPVVDAHEEGLVATDEQRAQAKTTLTMHNNHDGTLSGHFTLPIFHGELLRKIIQTMTAPRRTHSKTSSTGRGSSSGRGGGSGRSGGGVEQGTFGSNAPAFGGLGSEGFGSGGFGSEAFGAAAYAGSAAKRAAWNQAQGQALCELIEHLPTDHLHPKTAATMIITIDETVLRGRLAAAGLDTGDQISAAKARHLACTAGLLPAVMNGESQVLDLGRTKRLFTEAQRTALATKYTTCAAEHCDRPFAWSELHHLTPWSHGGPTNLDQAVPLCHYHHTLIHNNAYQHTRNPSGRITFTNRQ